MDDGLANLALLAVLFVGSHLYFSHLGIRKFFIHRWGVWPFRIIYSTVSVILFLQMLASYKVAPYMELFQPALILAPLIVMAPAAILIVCGYTVSNPSAAGLDTGGYGETIPGILKITRQPVMWGVGLFAVSHMLANPDAANLIFFGALAVLALGGAFHLDRRKCEEGGENWEALCEQSSFVPFWAILSGRARVTPGQIGWLRIAGGLALFAGLVLAHEAAIGVAPLTPELMQKIQV